MRVENIFESMSSNEVEFGINEETNDKKVGQIGSNQYTFFKDGSYVYAVTVDKDGVFGFAANYVYSANPRQYSTDRFPTKNAFTLFGKIMYVLSELVKNAKRPIYYLKFAAADEKLSGLYAKMVKNQRLLKEIRMMGFRYAGVADEMGVERFIFARNS